MSIDVMTAVWKHSEAKGSALLTLLAIADNADDDGFAFPSYDHMAAKTRMSKRTVQRTVSQLLDTNELSLVSGGTWGRSNVYAVQVAKLRSKPPLQMAKSDTQVANSGGQQVSTEPSVSNRHTESSEKLLPPSGDAGTLFPQPETSRPVKDAAADDPRIGQLHDAYVATFGERMRVKELTAPRAKVYRKALVAVGWDLELCKRAIHGLKSYRDSHPAGSKDVSPSVIFETGPHSGRSLTDQIEWWADQSSSETAASLPNVPSVLHARVTERKLTVVQMYQQPDNGSLRERGEQAVNWLREHAKIEPVVTDGAVSGWVEVAA